MEVHELKNDCLTCGVKDKNPLCHLTPSLLQSLNQHKRPMLFRRGEVIYREGEVNRGVYCLSKGSLKLTRYNNNGKEFISGIKREGHIIGYRSLLLGGLELSSAVALSELHCCYIEKAFFEKLLSHSVMTAFQLMQELTREIEQSEQKCFGFYHKTVKARMGEFLLLHCSQLPTAKEPLDFQLEMTREEIASYLGATPETVTRAITSLKVLGVIETSGKKIRVFDREKLVEIAQVT